MANSVITESAIKQNKVKLKLVKYRRFNLIFLLSAFLPLLTLGFFNFLIDPYDIFNSPHLPQINNAKIKKNDNDRLYKAIDIIKLKPSIVIMGSSRTKQAISPQHSVFDKQQTVYNLGLNNANIYEIRRYLEHSISQGNKLRTVIIGLDFWMFNKFIENQSTFTENRLEKNYITIEDNLNAIFSLATVGKSFETIKTSVENVDYQNDINGFTPSKSINDGKNKWRFNKTIELSFDFHDKYELSSKYLQDFQAIFDICQKNNIELIIFISPSHASQWESIYVAGQWENFAQWKRELVQILPVWDFSGYNSITREPIEDKMNNYVDNSHYTPLVGDLVLNRIYNQNLESIPPDFGVLISPDNIEEHLVNIRQQRLIWVQNNSEEVKLVRDTYQKFLSKNKPK
jgi:hypothetical protein